MCLRGQSTTVNTDTWPKHYVHGILHTLISKVFSSMDDTDKRHQNLWKALLPGNIIQETAKSTFLFSYCKCFIVFGSSKFADCELAATTLNMPENLQKMQR